MLPTALLAAPEGAVRETVLITLPSVVILPVILTGWGSTNSWIRGIWSETNFNFTPNSFIYLLKKYSGPFLLFPPVNNKVSILGYLCRYPNIFLSSTFCNPRSDAPNFSRSALFTISQIPIWRFHKKSFRCCTACLVVSKASPSPNISSKIGHNCPSLLP